MVVEDGNLLRFVGRELILGFVLKSKRPTFLGALGREWQIVYFCFQRSVCPEIRLLDPLT